METAGPCPRMAAATERRAPRRLHTGADLIGKGVWAVAATQRARMRPGHVREIHQGTQKAAASRPETAAHIGATCEAISRIWSARARCRTGEARRSSSIWDTRCRAPQATYLHRKLAGRLPPTQCRGRCYLALHPVGFAWPPRSPGAPVRSCRTLSPLAPDASGVGLLSVARAVVPAIAGAPSG